jgi:hypothetical protein
MSTATTTTIKKPLMKMIKKTLIKKPAAAASKPPAAAAAASKPPAPRVDERLHKAVTDGDEAAVLGSLRAGENDWEAMLLAATEDKPGIVMLMLERGCEVDHRSFGQSQGVSKVLINHLKGDPKELARALNKISNRAISNRGTQRKKNLREDAVKLVHSGARIPTVAVPFASGRYIDMVRAASATKTIDCLMGVINDLLKERNNK